MRLVIAAVGRARPGPEKSLYDDYVARLPWQVEVVEIDVRERLAAPRLKQREGQRLLKAAPAEAVVVALDEGGKALTSKALAEAIGRWRDDRVKALAFILGGADGLAPKVLERADLVLSLGPMTWPHMLARAMLAEQLYRAATILSGHPYHRA